MFVNCPHCRALVATDPATDQPPTHCPECGGPLRGQAPAEDAGLLPADDIAGDAADAPATGPHDASRDSWWDEAASRPSPPAETAAGDIAADDGLAGVSDTDAGATALPADAATATPTATPPAAAPGDTAPAALAQAKVAPLRGSAPGFLRRRTDAPLRGDWRMPAAVVGLSLLLGLQVLLADRARLAGQAGWRPLLSTLCAGLGCSLPPWREPAAFALLQRDVRQHPSVPGALRVSATFRNDARWPQPWPQLQHWLATLTTSPGFEQVMGKYPQWLAGAPPTVFPPT